MASYAFGVGRNAIFSRTLLLTLLLVSALNVRAGTVQGIHFSHEDWEIACDNTRACRAAGYQSDQADRAVSVLLTRKAGPNQPVSAELMLGIPIAGGNDSRNTDSTYLRYYKLKAELRLFPANRFFYIGPQLFYTNKRQSKYDGIVMGQDGKDYQYRYAELRKNIFGFIIKAGRVFPLSEKWNLEGSFGLGPRFVNLKLDATNLDQSPNYIRILYWRSDKMGTTVALHVETTFKLSYTIF